MFHNCEEINGVALTLSGIMIFGRTRDGDMSIVFLCFGLCLSRSLCFCRLRIKQDRSMKMIYLQPLITFDFFASYYSLRSIKERKECEAVPHHHKCGVKERKCQKQAKGFIRTQEQKRDNVHG